MKKEEINYLYGTKKRKLKNKKKKWQHKGKTNKTVKKKEENMKTDSKHDATKSCDEI